MSGSTHICKSPTSLSFLGTKSYASILNAKSSYDAGRKNLDIFATAVLTVLKAKKPSVKVLKVDDVALTAFIRG